MKSKTDTLNMIRKTASEFAKKELARHREELDNHQQGAVLDSILDKIFEMDFFHFAIPESNGGTGEGISSLCAALEEICSEDAGIGSILFSHTFSMKLLAHAGASKEMDEICSAGKTARQIIVASPCYNNPSEIEYFADAIPDRDAYLLSGQIPYVVPAFVSSKAIVPGKIKGCEGFSWFLVDMNLNSADRGKPVKSLGMHICEASDLTLSNASGKLVGSIGKGSEIFENAADDMQLATAAMSSGIMKGSLKEAVEYARRRNQGGRKIVNWSELRMILANMSVQAETAEMILARGCELAENKTQGWKHSARAAAIQILSSACDLTTDGVQVLGGVGYMKDFGQEKRMRDAKQVQALLGLFPLKKLRFFESR
jgi:alkylation response protein AidB-like acyl-CoA dehydrogenase